MAQQTQTEFDVYLSYAYLDDQPGSRGDGIGWVSQLAADLETRLAQFIGRNVSIWRRRDGDEDEDNLPVHPEMLSAIQRSAVMVVILSPAYINSELTHHELEEFIKAKDAAGASDLPVIFPVYRMPVPDERIPPLLQDIQGIQFYESVSGTPRELSPSTDTQEASLYFHRIASWGFVRGSRRPTPKENAYHLNS